MLPIILPIAFCIMLLIFLLAGCDSIIEYIVCSLFSMFGSIFLTFLSLVVCVFIIECANPETYSAETIATYDIIALSDNFSSEDGLCYSFLYQLQSLLKQIKLTFKKLPTLHMQQKTLSALKIPS